MSEPRIEVSNRWAGAWLDGLAFVLGLGMAWWSAWQTADLVWSLWLSSLTVGYALIVWNLSSALREFSRNALRDKMLGATWGKLAFGAVLAAGFLFGLAFFTVHFGGFHYVHSVFLRQFFPLDASADAGFPSWGLYAEVVRRYWIFVPIAFLAERSAFRWNSPEPSDNAVTADAIAQRQQNAMGGLMMAPYKNVIRMHLLIFFFFATHFLRVESFAVYAVVYAVYFFPWRLVKRAE